MNASDAVGRAAARVAGTAGAPPGGDRLAALRRALRDLHDPLALAAHPFASRPPDAASRAAHGSSAATGRALRARLLAAIEALRPPPSTPATARAARAFRLLTQRYVEGLTVIQVRQVLGIGESEYHRAHSRALAALDAQLAPIQPSATSPAPPRRHAAPSWRVRRPTLPLIGRAEIVDTLTQTLGLAVLGEGRGVLLHGDAGIGKTRLVEEVLWRLQEWDGGTAGPSSGPRTTIAVGHCHETTDRLAFAPFVAAISRLAAQHPPESVLTSEPHWLPHLLQFTSATAAEVPTTPARDPDLPTGAQLQLFEAVGRYLGALPRPLVLALEDLHWADEPSLQLLAYLLRHAASDGMAVLATIRAGDTPTSTVHLLRLLERESLLRWIDVHPLTEAESAGLVTAVAGDVHASHASQIFEHARGNALFTVELARAARTAVLVPTSDRTHDSTPATAGRPAAGPANHVPPVVVAVVANRVARLPAPTRILLHAASLFPAGADATVLARCADLTLTDALDAADPALAAGLLAERDGHVSFSHDLVRLAVAAQLAPGRRRQLHASAYVTLLEHAGASPSPSAVEELARLAAGGALWREAAGWWETAAGHAQILFALETAGDLLDRAIDCYRRLAPSTERDQELGRLQERQRGTRATATLIEDSVAAQIQGRVRDARRIAAALVSHGSVAGTGVYAAALEHDGIANLLAGRARHALAPLERAHAICLQLHPADAASTAARIALAHALLGDFTRSASFLEDAVDLLSHDPAPHRPVVVSFHAALCASVRGHWPDAVERATASATAAGAAGLDFLLYLARIWLGHALSHTGHLTRAFVTLHDAQASAEVHGFGAQREMLHLFLAVAHFRAGQPAAARRELDHARRRCEADDLPLAAALVDLLDGLMHHAAAKVPAAHDSLSSALSRLSVLEARPYLARCHAALGVLAASAAGKHAALARSLFHAMAMPSDPLP